MSLVKKIVTRQLVISAYMDPSNSQMSVGVFLLKILVSSSIVCLVLSTELIR